MKQFPGGIVIGRENSIKSETGHYPPIMRHSTTHQPHPFRIGHLTRYYNVVIVELLCLTTDQSTKTVYVLSANAETKYRLYWKYKKDTSYCTRELECLLRVFRRNCSVKWNRIIPCVPISGGLLIEYLSGCGSPLLAKYEIPSFTIEFHTIILNHIMGGTTLY